jgi:hypothetical protein
MSGGARVSAAGVDGGERLSTECGGDGGRGELEWLPRVNSRLTLAVAWDVPARAAGVRRAATVKSGGRDREGDGDSGRVPRACRELEFKRGAAMIVQLQPKDAVEAGDGVRAQKGEERGAMGTAVTDAERARKRERLVPLHGAAATRR